MHKKSLIKTNPYLKDPKRRRELIHKAVTSSTAIETGHIVKTYPVHSKRARKTVSFKKPAKASESHR